MAVPSESPAPQPWACSDCGHCSDPGPFPSSPARKVARHRRWLSDHPSLKRDRPLLRCQRSLKVSHPGILFCGPANPVQRSTPALRLPSEQTAQAAPSDGSPNCATSKLREGTNPTQKVLAVRRKAGGTHATRRCRSSPNLQCLGASPVRKPNARLPQRPGTTHRITSKSGGPSVKELRQRIFAVMEQRDEVLRAMRDCEGEARQLQARIEKRRRRQLGGAQE